MFDDFHQGKLDVSRINYGTITLLAKVPHANKIQQYRPICLLNCLYKWIPKILTIRLDRVAEKLILPIQTTFMKGRNIMSGVMALHEIVHETKRSGQVGVILKLDFEKAYDKLCWDFLFESLRARNFNTKWCGWIRHVVMGGTVSVKINKQSGPYFVSKKGVRQGDPMPPILFNMAADCLSRMVRKAQNGGLIIGLADNLIPKGIAMLQYADDTIICIKDDDEIARNVKLMLYLYEAMSGLKINFTKSEVILINGDDDRRVQLADTFNCKIGFSLSSTLEYQSALADYS
jgi:hypothetical protein